MLKFEYKNTYTIHLLIEYLKPTSQEKSRDLLNYLIFFK